MIDKLKIWFNCMLYTYFFSSRRLCANLREKNGKFIDIFLGFNYGGS